MTNYDESAKKIIKFVGGKENIQNAIHCSTRLRFTLSDFDKIDKKDINEVDGVLGSTVSAGQYQIIIGNDVIEMYDAVTKELGDLSNTGTKKPKMKIGEVLFDFIIGIFQPLVPAIAGGGMIKSLLILFVSLGWMSNTSQVYSVMNMIGSAPLTFLPILVAYTTAVKLKVNPLVSISAVAALLLPDMTAALAEGISLFGIKVTNIAYASQVFPAVLCILLYAFLEKELNKYTPKSIRVFFVPMVALAITVPITLLFLGPIGYTFGEVLSSMIVFLYNKLGFVATAILAGLLPLMVSLGMHKAFIPYSVAQLANTASEPLYLPASLGHNFAESGVCFAAALKTKDKKLRATAISAGISALFGITEPALYGVTLQHKRALASVMISGAIGGGFVGFVGLKAFVLVGPGIASLSMYSNPKDSMNLIWAIVGTALTLVISFIIGYLTWKDQEVQDTESEPLNNLDVDIKLDKPVNGKVIPLSEVSDDVFASGMLGDGIAIIPEEGKLYAPADGEIEVVYDTNHAIGMKLLNGSEILFHIGLDTVQLKGKGFTPHVKQNDHVKKGDLLMEFDLDEIQKEGYDPTVMMIVTNQTGSEVDLPVATI